MVELAEYLESVGKQCAVVGAIALAVHGYVRGTEDWDFGVTSADPRTLFEGLHGWLESAHPDLNLTYTMPDDDDPLGGVATITGEEIPDVDIINFFNPLHGRTGPAGEAIETALPDNALHGLRVVRPEYLAALKLTAGSFKDLGDAVELLKTSDIDDELLNEIAEKYRLVKVLKEVRRQADRK